VVAALPCIPFYTAMVITPIETTSANFPNVESGAYENDEDTLTMVS
jgi:hypothetical protein